MQHHEPLDVNDLAVRLYVELASRVTLAPTQADKPKPSPDVLARMAYKLADAFRKVQEERFADPVVDKYEVKLSDVGG
jgi:hypothetical protein